MRTAFAFFFALIFSTSVEAVLIESDWLVVGDGLITQDTSNNLEWLDLTQATARSFNDVSAQLGVGGEFEGFRFATFNEWEGLLLEAGLPCCGGFPTFDNFTDARALQDLIGFTDFTHIAGDQEDQWTSIGNLAGGIATAGFRASLDELPNQDTFDFQFGFSSFTSTLGNPEASFDSLGNWLVRTLGSGPAPEDLAVPEPSTLSLLAAWFLAFGLPRMGRVYRGGHHPPFRP